MNLPIEFNNECQAFRSIPDFIQWADGWLSKINSDPANKTAALTHRGTYKNFYEETLPLWSLLKIKSPQWGAAEFRNVVGSQPYDVETRNHELNFYEIACCDFDEEENFRMRQFLSAGFVSTLASVIRDERGRPIGFDDDGCKLHSEVIAKILNTIRVRITLKCGKIYPEKTGLIIYYFDYLIDEDDMILFEGLLASTKPMWSSKFPAIYLVGPKAKFHFEAFA